MSIQTVSIFNQTLNPNVENQSSSFTGGIGFYLIAPLATVEYEIDIFLQVQLSNSITRMVRLEPLNLSTTERLTVIPIQLRDLGLPMYLAIYPSEAFQLEVLLLQDNCSLNQICQDLTEIQEDVTDISATFDFINIALNLVTNFLGIPQPVLPPTVAQTEFFLLQ